MLFSKGAKSVIPVAKVDEAFLLKETHPSYLIAGERKGVKIAGFDMGNSPYEVNRTDVTGRHIILTTSAGTQGMIQAKGAEKLLIGSFGNVSRVIGILQAWEPTLVTWLPIGTEGKRKAIEDDSCAVFFKKRLENIPCSILPLLGDMMEGEGARRLKRLGQENDFPYCLCTDIFDIGAEVFRENDNTLTIKPIMK
jgi:2-phosphosulfolactate phosphatase